MPVPAADNDPASGRAHWLGRFGDSYGYTGLPAGNSLFVLTLLAIPLKTATRTGGTVSQVIALDDAMSAAVAPALPEDLALEIAARILNDDKTVEPLAEKVYDWVGHDSLPQG
jgi:hypothetical protein